MNPIPIYTHHKIQKNNYPGIYQISNYTNNKIYIGSSINITKRIFQQHLNLLRKNKHHSIHLQNHFNKYREEDLLFDVIEKIKRRRNEILEDFKEKLIAKEDYWIKKLKPAFNMNSKASSNLGIKMSKEVRQHLREVQTKLIGVSIIQYDLQGKYLNTYPSLMEASRQTNMSRTTIYGQLNGRTITGKFLWCYPDEDISEKVKQYNKQIENAKVFQFDLGGNFIAEYKNQVEAQKQTGSSLGSSSINSCISGKSKTANGFIWSGTRNLSNTQLRKVNKRHKRHILWGTEKEEYTKKRIDALLKTKAAENKPIDQYNLKGNFIKSYSSKFEASLKTKINSWNITRSMQNIRISAGGYFWVYKGQSINTKLKQQYFKINPIAQKQVFQFSMNGILLNKYKSINETSRCTKTSCNGIRACLTNSQTYTGDYIFTNGHFPTKHHIKIANENRNFQRSIGNYPKCK